MGTPSRFFDGISTDKKGQPLGMYGRSDPTKWHDYFEDFDRYNAADWTVTETQIGATQALADGDGGTLLLTNSAVDDDLISLQKVGESFRWDSSKKLFMKTRFKVSDATQSDVLIGLSITDASPIISVPTDGIHFLKTDGAATIIGKSGKGSVYASSGTITSLAADTYIELAMSYEGRPRTTLGITYYDFDCYYKTSAGIWVASAGISALAANLPDTEDLTPTISLQNGEAAAKTMTIDYLFISKER